MVLYINILILNPDEFVHKKASESVVGTALGNLATQIVDHGMLTETIALSVKRRAEDELRDKHNLNVDVKVKESYSLYCVIELHVKSLKKGGVFDLFGACCETEATATFVTERAMAMALPGSLKNGLRAEGIEADVVVVRETSKQEEYEHKVLDLLYSHLDQTQPQGKDPVVQKNDSSPTTTPGAGYPSFPTTFGKVAGY